MSILNAIVDSLESQVTRQELSGIFSYYPTVQRRRELIKAKDEIEELISLAKSSTIINTLEEGLSQINNELKLYRKINIERKGKGSYIKTMTEFTDEELDHYEDYLKELINHQKQFNEDRFYGRRLHFVEENMRYKADECLYIAEQLLNERRV